MTMSVPESNSGSGGKEEESEDESEILEESPCGRWQKRKEQVAYRRHTLRWWSNSALITLGWPKAHTAHAFLKVSTTYITHIILTIVYIQSTLFSKMYTVVQWHISTYCTSFILKPSSDQPCCSCKLAVLSSSTTCSTTINLATCCCSLVAVKLLLFFIYIVFSS